MIKYNIILFFIFLNLLFSNEKFNYKIKYFGLHAANCSISITDTLFHNNFSKKINFNVQTKPFFEFLFPINNTYSIILSSENRILYFYKNTTQPKIKNKLNTNFINNKVLYSGNNVEILPEYYNIFSVLYIILSGKELPSTFVIEREGLIYNASVDFFKDKSMYLLNTQILENSEYDPIIKDTDIFTWALFMENTEKKIFINSDTRVIEKCIFSKGITKVSAHLID